MTTTDTPQQRDQHATATALLKQRDRDALRDRFAAAIVTGELSHGWNNPIIEATSFAKFCYDLADAMIAERDRRS
jgi:hypothetical protein